MSQVAVLGSEPLAANAFHGHTGGLWDAIVDQLALRDPAGSGLAGPSWLGQPSLGERGMFDFVSPTTSG